MDKRFIVISIINDASQHANWLNNDTQLFDTFFISEQHNEALKSQATFYECLSYESKHCGSTKSNALNDDITNNTGNDKPLDKQCDKYWILANLLQEYWELLATYDVFWFPDAQLAATTSDINRLFKLFDGHSLTLAEPMFLKEGDEAEQIQNREAKDSYAVLMRFTDKVSTIAPLMSRDTLITLHPSFLAELNDRERADTWSEAFKPNKTETNTKSDTENHSKSGLSSSQEQSIAEIWAGSLSLNNFSYQAVKNSCTTRKYYGCLKFLRE